MCRFERWIVHAGNHRTCFSFGIILIVVHLVLVAERVYRYRHSGAIIVIARSSGSYKTNKLETRRRKQKKNKKKTHFSRRDDQPGSVHWIHKVSVFTLTAPSSFCSRSGDASPGYARKGWTGFYRSTGTSTSIKWSDGSSAFSVWSTRWLTSSTTVSDCSLASVDLAFLLVRSPYFVLPTCHGNRPEFDPFLVMLVPHTQKVWQPFDRTERFDRLSREIASR